MASVAPSLAPSVSKYHPSQPFRPAPARVTVVPELLVHTQDLHVLEPGRIVRGPVQEWADVGPERVPRRAELAGEALGCRPLAAELSDRPPDRTVGQQAPWLVGLGVLLDE